MENKIEVIKKEGFALTLAGRSFKAGNVIFKILGDQTNIRDRYTIQIEPNLHIMPGELSGKFVNHSCSPNTMVNADRQFVALKDIQKGDELTFDYQSTEDELAEQFDCNCGSKGCRGVIK